MRVRDESRCSHGQLVRPMTSHCWYRHPHMVGGYPSPALSSDWSAAGSRAGRPPAIIGRSRSAASRPWCRRVDSSTRATRGLGARPPRPSTVPPGPVGAPAPGVAWPTPGRPRRQGRTRVPPRAVPPVAAAIRSMMLCSSNGLQDSRDSPPPVPQRQRRTGARAPADEQPKPLTVSVRLMNSDSDATVCGFLSSGNPADGRRSMPAPAAGTCRHRSSVRPYRRPPGRLTQPELDLRAGQLPGL